MSRGPDGPVVRARLRNGLEVRLKEIHTAPLVSVWIWYRVGSRNEIPGRTGISHWVEHMQFKGTPTFPAGVLDRVISRDGGMWNAFTWIDWTAYFETLPAERVDLALRLEADRMEHSRFDAREVEAERTVILSERQGHENDPVFRLSEEVLASAFRVHSYHHEVIGEAVDLRRMTRQELYEHYRRHYVPGNAVLAAAGDFRAGRLLRQIREIFGPIPASPPPEARVRPEPEPRGERRVVVEGPEDTPYLNLAYRAPPARDPDIMPLAVVDSVLAGASSLNPFGGGISNKTSRLYRALVDRGIAAAVSGDLALTIDPFLYSIRVTLRPDRTPEEALAAADVEIARMAEEIIQPEELKRAIKQARAMFAFSSESVTNQAFWLGYSEMFADDQWFETYLERLEAVQPEDVLRVAQAVLRPSNRVVGFFRPNRALMGSPQRGAAQA